MVRPPKNQNENDMNDNLHTAENSGSKLSAHQRAKNQLGMYLCYLTEKKRLARTSHEEDRKIELLIQSKEAGYPDSESTVLKLYPLELNS